MTPLRVVRVPPSSATGFVRVGKRIFLGAAERIVPNDSRARTTLSRHFVLVYLLPLDAAGLVRLETDFHIAGLAWSDHGSRSTASFPVRDARGAVIAYLAWNAATPGATFARTAAPFAFACFVLVSALQLIVLRSWLQAASKLRDESASRTMFLANASHDLRTPLNAIIGFSECLARELFGPLSPRYKSYANDIHLSGKLLLGIVNDVLDLTRITNGDSVATEPVQVAIALRQPLRILSEYAKPDSVEIRFTDKSRNAVVRANEKALSQILLNLGSNAVKFTPSGGIVEIALARDGRGECVELSVRDRGTGIPPDKLRLIGQPFLRVHQGNELRPGSGLGLAIVKSLAQNLGGEFFVESSVGAGTTATVKIPICSDFEEAA